MNEFIEFLGIVRGITWVYLWGVFLAATALLLFDRGRRSGLRLVESGLQTISPEPETAERKKAA